MATRLSVDSGSLAVLRNSELPPIRWLQHRWESRRVRRWDAAQVYRVVVGARLEGETTPHAELSLTLPLISNRGRRFSYRDRQRADARGHFSFVVPYATEAPSSGTRPMSRVRITTTDAEARVHIDEAAVETGQTVRVELLPLDRELRERDA